MIIGVALIVDELHKGPRSVFRYPDHIPPSTYDTVEDDITRLHREYLSMSSDNFAKLFRPKTSMTNKILELTIDDLHYYSYPIPCNNEENDGIAGSGSGASSSGSTIISLFNVIIVTVKKSALLNILQKRLLQLHNSVKAIQSTIFPSKHALLMGNRPIHSASGGKGNVNCTHERDMIYDPRLGGGGNSYLGGVLIEIEEELKKINCLLSSNACGSSSGNSFGLSACGGYKCTPGRSGSNPLKDIVGLEPQQFTTSFIHNHASKALFGQDVEGQTDCFQFQQFTYGASVSSTINYISSHMKLLSVEQYCNVSESMVRKVVEVFSQALCHQEKRQKYVTCQVASIFKILENSSKSSSNAPVSSSFSTSRGDNGIARNESGIMRNDSSASNSSISSSINGVALPPLQVNTTSFEALNILTDAVDHGNIGTPVKSTNVNSSNHQPSPSSHLIQNQLAFAESQKPCQPLLTKNQTDYEHIMQQSLLANELRALYHGLKTGHSIVLNINNYVGINIKLNKSDDSCDYEQHHTSVLLEEASCLCSTYHIMNVIALLHSSSDSRVASDPIFISKGIGGILHTTNNHFVAHTINGTDTGYPNKARAYLDMLESIEDRRYKLCKKVDNRVLQPYHTCLLVGSPDVVMDAMKSLGAKTNATHFHSMSPSMEAFIRACSPTVSFYQHVVNRMTDVGGRNMNRESWEAINSAVKGEEVGEGIGAGVTEDFGVDKKKQGIIKQCISEFESLLVEVYEFTAQLCDWGLARVMHTLTNDSVYRVHEEAPLHANSLVLKSFIDNYAEWIPLPIPAQHRDGRDRIASSSESESIDEYRHSRSSTVTSSTSTNSSDVFQNAEWGSPGQNMYQNMQGIRPVKGNTSIASTSKDSEGEIISGPFFNSVEHMLNCTDAYYSILGLFDGRRNVKDILEKLPKWCQKSDMLGLDVIRWMLQWNMLVEKSTYLLYIPMPRTDAAATANSRNMEKRNVSCDEDSPNTLSNVNHLSTDSQSNTSENSNTVSSETSRRRSLSFNMGNIGHSYEQEHVAEEKSAEDMEGMASPEHAHKAITVDREKSAQNFMLKHIYNTYFSTASVVSVPYICWCEAITQKYLLDLVQSEEHYMLISQ